MVTGLLRGLWALLVGERGPSVPIETTDVQLDPWGVPTGPVENLDAEVARLKELAATIAIDPRCPCDARYCTSVKWERDTAREDRDYYKRLAEYRAEKLEKIGVAVVQHGAAIARLKQIIGEGAAAPAPSRRARPRARSVARRRRAASPRAST